MGCSPLTPGARRHQPITRELFEPYFETFAEQCGVTFEELFALGRRADEPDGKFDVAGASVGGTVDGVAQLHGQCRARCFGGM